MPYRTLILAAALVLTTSTTAEAASKYPCEKRAEQHKNIALDTIDNAYRHQKWRDPSLTTNKQRHKIAGNKKCLGQWGKGRVSRYRSNAADSRAHWRAAKASAWDDLQFQRAYLPYNCGSAGWFAIPCYIVACESGYYWGAYNSSGAAGVYQIMPEHGRPWPANTEEARRAHHIIASRLWNGGSGASNWVCA